ncbi:MAG: Melibiose operon regulatory protein [Betaproteobacteria bacterium ADurb.Bin341]|nr:MAG: Melibiose operon regulatory protein [Betaproteobacteria bacterium ADurb.Bin341]HOG02111.1 AraC family transcriptional regulator [Clostridia bacterium]
MGREYELVMHPRLKHICCFVVEIDYRTPHLHREMELSLILSGSLSVSTQGLSSQLREGDLALFNANQVHEYHAEGAPARMLCIQVIPQFCHDSFPSLQNTRFSDFCLREHLGTEEYALCRAMAVEFAYRYCRRDFGYELECDALLRLIFSILVQRVPNRVLPDGESGRSRERVERLNRILDYIDANYMNKIQLGDLAQSEGISTYYLSHFFTDHLNCSFQNYLFQVRMRHARALVASTDKKLIDVCLECGFSDYRYLNRAFQQQFGCTPNEYRSLSRQAGDEAREGGIGSVERFLTEQEMLTELKAYRQTHAAAFETLLRLFPNGETATS